MTVERPVDRGEVWLVNATMGDADFYVNDHTPVADVAALRIGPELHVKGDAHSPYGAHAHAGVTRGRLITAHQREQMLADVAAACAASQAAAVGTGV